MVPFTIILAFIIVISIIIIIIIIVIIIIIIIIITIVPVPVYEAEVTDKGVVIIRHHICSYVILRLVTF